MFEALNHLAVPSRGETHENQLAQILIDIQEEGQQAKEEDNEDENESRGIDLMVSDDEEETEYENEEDRAFLDDEVNENDPSFF